ncbi:hypothetical protein FRC91_16235 [Bradymonadales bacterium TMQ1]|nr:hypothetical protein FRC91_16235 [Bradymonadales bacterium TMQ1]
MSAPITSSHGRVVPAHIAAVHAPLAGRIAGYRATSRRPLSLEAETNLRVDADGRLHTGSEVGIRLRIALQGSQRAQSALLNSHNARHLVEVLQDTIDENFSGMSRITSIVSDLRDVARPSSSPPRMIVALQDVTTTLMEMVFNALRYQTNVSLKAPPELAFARGQPLQPAQAILNPIPNPSSFTPRSPRAKRPKNLKLAESTGELIC